MSTGHYFRLHSTLASLARKWGTLFPFCWHSAMSAAACWADLKWHFAQASPATTVFIHGLNSVRISYGRSSFLINLALIVNVWVKEWIWLYYVHAYWKGGGQTQIILILCFRWIPPVFRLFFVTSWTGQWRETESGLKKRGNDLRHRTTGGNLTFFKADCLRG